jgi:hypothetical protein
MRVADMPAMLAIDSRVDWSSAASSAGTGSSVRAANVAVGKAEGVLVAVGVGCAVAVGVGILVDCSVAAAVGLGLVGRVAAGLVGTSGVTSGSVASGGVDVALHPMRSSATHNRRAWRITG